MTEYKMTLNNIAGIVSGKVIGDGKVSVSGIASPYAAGESDITFVMKEEDSGPAVESKAAGILTASEKIDCRKPVIHVKDMKTALTILYNVLEVNKVHAKGFIHPSAVIDETVVLGKDVVIGPNVTIGAKTRIGDNTVIEASVSIGKRVVIGERGRLYPNVSIYNDSQIGNKVIIHSGAVIGADGFGYVPKDGKIFKVPQLGRVVIEDNVEIGANTCIDRGTFTDTVVGANTKIDNLVQVAHNVKMGKNVFMAGQSGIAGSSSIGDGSMVGGQGGISDHIHIGKNVKIAAQAGVTRPMPADGITLYGMPAREARDAIKQLAFSKWLYRNARAVKAILRKSPEMTASELKNKEEGEE